MTLTTMDTMPALVVIERIFPRLGETATTTEVRGMLGKTR